MESSERKAHQYKLTNYLNRQTPFPTMLWISCQALEDKYRKNIKIVHLAKTFLLFLLYPPGKARLLNNFSWVSAVFALIGDTVLSTAPNIKSMRHEFLIFLFLKGRPNFGSRVTGLCDWVLKRTNERTWLDFALLSRGTCSTLAIPRRLAGASGDWPRQKSQPSLFQSEHAF